MNKIRVGIVGSAGYTGGELLRILVFHPSVEIVFANSVSNAGNKVYEVHKDLLGDTELEFSSEISPEIDLLFLCMGHGYSKQFLQDNLINQQVKIIDLSQDFRLRKTQVQFEREFVYGLPELNREKIQEAHNIANPGCFATNIQLALLPLAFHQLLPDQLHIHATTGSTGAGQNPSASTHFSWRNNNLSVYKAFNHQHLQEISESLDQLQTGFLDTNEAQEKSLLELAAAKINLIPHRGDFSRGIFSSIYLKSDLSLEAIFKIYEEYYAKHPFTFVTLQDIDLKQVVNTNKTFIQIQKHGDQILILSITDNLLKGASGQAVQNMNLMFGLDEKAGLNLKSIAF